jgi:hypothetical protein
MEATLRLFKAVPVKDSRYRVSRHPAMGQVLKQLLPVGLVFHPAIYANYSVEEWMRLAQQAIDTLGVSGQQANSSFHKSWQKIATAPAAQLIMEQLLNYITVYGAESVGLFSHDTVYIPLETLDIPELDNLELTVIHGYTKDELKDKLMALLSSGIALQEQTVKDAVTVAKFVDLGIDEVEQVRNKEVKVALYDMFNMVPRQPEEFLRYLLYKTIGQTLLIKDPATIQKLELQADPDIIELLLFNYALQDGLSKLGSIFYRFKPLFLAMRKNAGLKSIINKIRKLAKKYHRSMAQDYLNQITAECKRIDGYHEELFLTRLQNANIFRKIRLLQALNFRYMASDSPILYKIRNGKSYVKDQDRYFNEELFQATLTTFDSIAGDLKHLTGKKIYIPRNIKYALPTTEKQFSGYLPASSYITVPNDIIFGIWWENYEGERIDLDLSLIEIDQKFGWNGYWREDGVLFSGDMTDGHNGATELFYVKPNNKSRCFVIMVNDYTMVSVKNRVPFKIIVGSQPLKKLPTNYMLDPNKIVATVNTHMIENNQIIGLVETGPTECRFYFSQFSQGNNHISSDSVHTRKTREFLIRQQHSLIYLDEALKEAQAVLVDDPAEADIDLSIQNLQKDTFINLLTGK